MATVAHLASPLIYVGEVLLPAVHISYFFGNAASKFLVKVLDTNTSPIQLGATALVCLWTMRESYLYEGRQPD